MFFFSVNSFITFIISCRLNGVQLLTVHVQWSFLVTRTTMSYAIASSIFAGMYAGSILLMTQLSFSWVLVIKYVRLYQYSLPFAVHRGSSSTSELWDCIQVDIEEQRRIWTYELVCHKLNTVVLYAIFKFCFQFQCHHVLVQTGQDFLDCVLNNAIYYDPPPPPDYLFCNIACFGSDWA